MLAPPSIGHADQVLINMSLNKSKICNLVLYLEESIISCVTGKRVIARCNLLITDSLAYKSKKVVENV